MNRRYERYGYESWVWLPRPDPAFRGRGPKGYRRSDERIREDIAEYLTEDPYIDASNMEVEVQDGEVTLSGTVPDRWSRRSAEDLAECVSGVRHVQNNLRIAAPGEEPGTKVHQDIAGVPGRKTGGVTPTPSISSQIGMSVP
jgi:hypothetical protein